MPGYKSANKSNTPALDPALVGNINPVTMPHPPRRTTPGRFYEGGGHTPPDLHDEMFIDLSKPGEAKPLSQVTFRAAQAHAKAGCPTCQAFLSGMARGARGREEIARQAQAKSATAGKTKAAPAPRQRVQMGGTTRLQVPTVTRAGGPRTPQPIAIPPTPEGVAYAQRLVRAAGTAAAGRIHQRPGELVNDWIKRVAEARGVAENAMESRMVRGA
jgi:hypothetical protein